MESVVNSAYAYADSAEHREGITAFLDKRSPFSEPTTRSNMSNLNLFAALRAAFPADLDAIAVETAVRRRARAVSIRGATLTAPRP
jgi:hypothetical protein